MRLRIGRFCSHIQVGLTTGQHNQFKIVIYQRDVNRRIIDLESALISLKNKLGFIAPNLLERINIFVIEHEEDRHPCALYRWLADADILLTAHGFQSTALLLMKPGAMLIEIFNFKYWKVLNASCRYYYNIAYMFISNILIFASFIQRSVTSLWLSNTDYITGGCKTRCQPPSLDFHFISWAKNGAWSIYDVVGFRAQMIFVWIMTIIFEKSYQW